uniref:Pre-mRNA-processing factor 17 n=1 Tax=Theileria annulata TaxID=5874 RepID=A0A3B0N8J7_THEAN
MDLIGSYDSDSESDQNLSQSTVNLTNPRFKRSKSNLNTSPNFTCSNQANSDPNPYNSDINPSNPLFNLNSSSEIELLSVEQNDRKLSCKTTLYSDYHFNSNLGNNTQTNKPQNDNINTKTEIRTFQNDDSQVLSIQLGSRYNSSGIVTIPSTAVNTATVTPSTVDNIKVNNIKHEHERKADDMMYENYAVDELKYKSHSEISNYTRNGSTFCYSASFGGVSVNPSGVTEKVYFNPTAFDTDLITNNNTIISNYLVSEHKTGTTGNTVNKAKRRLTQEEVSEDIFGPWIPYEEGELPVHPNTNATETDNSDKIESSKAKTTVGKGLMKCVPEKAEALNEVVTVDGKQFTQFNSLTVSTYNRKIESKYKPILSTTTHNRSATKGAKSTEKYYIPKNEVGVLTGHTMSVYRIEFLPVTGNVLLSCGMDGFVKVWDINSHKCLRNYKGHAKGVRDVSFIENGNKFYSASFDSNVILWDTEYGKVIGVYKIEKTPYCLTPYPLDDNVFLVGGDSNKIMQMDARSGEMVLEYSEHMGCVNTITFIDNNRRIVTTADDKRVLVWDYNIPVVVKSVSSPETHTIPSVTPHPSQKFILAQSMDNQILVYETSSSRFKLFGRKRFRGHQNSGYAIKPNCSPDGRYVISGDSRGKLFFWDWKTSKQLQTFSAHKMALMDSKWHPTLSSTIATCSWDGTIKIFQ